MITVRFWFGNLFATWIFVVLISSWRNSTLSVRSSDMSSSKRGIVLNSLIVLNKDEERTELDEMVVLDVGSINWICFWDRKETKNSSQRADVNMSHSQILGKFEYGWGPIFKVVLELFWTFSYLYLWHTMWFHVKKLLKTLKFENR